MKALKQLAVIWVMILFFACEPPVTFKEPQPADAKNLTSFPRRLRGTYFSLADSGLIRIDARTICLLYDANSMQPNDSDAIHISVTGDTSIRYSVSHNLQSLSISLSEEEGSRRQYFADTIFVIDQDHLLRKWRGYYFLNTRYDQDSWQVRRLSLKKGELSIGEISQEEEIKSLKAIAESFQDTVAPYQFKLSKKQFKQYNKGQSFLSNETFVKLK
jgi:hypothetical protein